MVILVARDHIKQRAQHQLIQRLRDMGTTLIVAEQNMHFCLDIASHVAVIDKGHIVYRGSIDELRANDDVKKRYLAV